MTHNKRLVHQWPAWQLFCVEEEEYLLVRHDGFSVDFDAAGDQEALGEAQRLMGEIDGGPNAEPM